MPQYGKEKKTLIALNRDYHPHHHGDVTLNVAQQNPIPKFLRTLLYVYWWVMNRVCFIAFDRRHTSVNTPSKFPAADGRTLRAFRRKSPNWQLLIVEVQSRLQREMSSPIIPLHDWMHTSHLAVDSTHLLRSILPGI